MFLCLAVFGCGTIRRACGAGGKRSRAIEAAQVELDRVDDGRDRVDALTSAIQAYESGLAAMRDGMRDVAIREQELTGKLAAQRGDISQLLGVLAGLGGQAEPDTFAHPGGPVGAARAGMLLDSVMPNLTARSATLERDLDEMKALRRIQQRGIEVLQQGLRDLQTARTDLSKAIADRTDLPRKFVEDPVRTAILISGSETLSAFSGGLSNITTDEVAMDLPDVSSRKGSLTFPVAGQILRRPGEADAAGVVRPGLVVATRPKRWSSPPPPRPCATVVRFWITGWCPFWNPSREFCLCLPACTRSLARQAKYCPKEVRSV